MPIFSYKAINSSHKKQTGQIEAQSLEDAKSKLRTQKILVTKLCKAKKGGLFTFSKQELRADHLTSFTTQLAELLGAKMPLYESLVSIEEQLRHEKYHPVILSICEQIKEGSSLSDALKKFPHSFSSLYIAMVRAGESVGILDQTLKELAHLLKKQQKLKKKLTSALIYPTLLILFSIVVITALLTFVIPAMETILDEESVNRFTKSLIWLSHTLRGGWFYITGGLVALLGSLAYYFKRPQAREKMISALFSLPILRTIVAKVSAARLARTLATLLQGGVAMIDALEIAKGVLFHPKIREEIEQAKQKIVEGSSLSQELKASKYLPALLGRMAFIGEESGKIGPMIDKVAEIYEEEVDKTLTRLVELAQPIILLVMGLVVGVIMLAVLIPLTDTNHFM